jgi:putative endonuclease
MTFRQAQCKKGWMYILECADGSYYTGSTNNLELRLQQHQNVEGANHTKKRLPVKLVYFEEFQRIDDAFYREKQLQGWSRKKKEALIEGSHEKLPELSLAYRDLPKVASCISRTSMLETTKPEPNPKPEALEGEALLPEALEGNINKLKR